MTTPSPYAFRVGDRILYDPMPGAQLEFLQSKETNVFLWGNRGGGKSITARMMCHGEALAHPGFIYVVVRKNYPDLHINHLMFLDDEMALFGGRYNSSEHICYYPNGSIGVYRQCATEADVKKVVGAQAALVVFDEAPELEWDWLRLIGVSVRVTKASGLKPRIRYLGNPIGPSIDQLFSYAVDKDVDRLLDPQYDPRDWKAIEIRMEHNEHLDVAEYQKQFAGVPAHIKRAWLDGVRVVDGAYFVIDPKRHHIDARPPLHGYVDPINGFVHPPPLVYRAIDWGWHDEAVCLWIAVYPSGRAIVFRELVRTHTTAKEFAELIKSHSEDVTVRETFCDPSVFPPQGSDIVGVGEILENSGIPLSPSRNDRVACGYALSEWLNTPLDDGLPALQWWPKGCPMLTKTFPQMRMDPKNPGRIADGRDHAVITCGYFCMGHSARPRIKQPGYAPTRISSLIKQIPQTTRARMGNESVRRRR